MQNLVKPPLVCIDDEPERAELLKLTLSQIGIQVFWVRDSNTWARAHNEKLRACDRCFLRLPKARNDRFRVKSNYAS